MNDRIFYDTNILVYAYDEEEQQKRRIAEKLVESVFNGDTKGVVSNQVLSELFNALTEKIEHPLSKEIAAKIIRKYALSDKWMKINYTSETVIRASLSSSYSNAPFWDALIAETMKENEILSIITENEKDFRRMQGIRSTNPLK